MIVSRDEMEEIETTRYMIFTQQNCQAEITVGQYYDITMKPQ